MFENLSEKLERSFKVLKGEGRITEINVAETLKEVRKALLDADVNYKVAKQFTDTVKAKAMGMNVLTAVKPGQLMVKIVHDELAELMGGQAVDIETNGSPAIILMSGLQGSGKTTFSGKLAQMLRTKRAKRPLLVACDVYRPAAIEQLRVLGEQIGVPVYTEPENKKPVEIAQNAIKEARKQNNDLVIIDTAGRLAVDEEMMNEIAALKKAVNPQEILFVVDAMTGQDAVNTAKAFNDRLDFTGVVLTKLDGDTRGGAALSIRTVVNKPIKFVGTGEKMEALDVFHPERMADRILGMGDIVSLVERAQEQYDEEEARRLQKKIAKNQFDFNDFIGQIQQVKKMGNLKDLASMIPGVGKAIKDIDIDDDAFKSIEAIIQSMTPTERSHPEVLNSSRRQRIARGSGTSIQEVNRLIKQFDDMRKMMRMMTQGKNPARMIDLPGAECKTQEIPTMEEMQKFLSALCYEEPVFQLFYFLAINTGMRRGELCALRWSDVIVTGSYEGYIIVQHSRSTVSGEGVQEGKTKNGRARTVSMNEEMFSLLHGFCHRKMRLRDEYGIPFPEYIFTKDDGTPIHPDTFSKHLKALFAEIGLPKTYHLHTLRHFFVSTLLHEGVDKNTVADLAGHGDTSFLERTYCHPQMQLKQEAAKRMSNSLFAAPNPELLVS